MCNVYILYDSIYAMNQNRQNRSMVLKVRLVVALEGQGSDCKRAQGDSWRSGNVPFLDLDVGYVAILSMKIHQVLHL